LINRSLEQTRNSVERLLVVLYPLFFDPTRSPSAGLLQGFGMELLGSLGKSFQRNRQFNRQRQIGTRRNQSDRRICGYIAVKSTFSEVIGKNLGTQQKKSHPKPTKILKDVISNAILIFRQQSTNIIHRRYKKLQQ
jgi:hypothetical protein